MIKVLIVDDERLIREGLRDFINWESLGMEIADTSGDGQDALQKVLALKPQIVLCDIRLPELSGLDVLRQARAKGSDSRFIFISAYSEFRYAQEALRLGASDYLLKPIEMDALSEVLLRCRSTLEVPAEAPEKSYQENFMADVTAFLEENFSREVSIAEISAHMGMSVSYTGKLFKKNMGCSISQYLYRLRMERAKALIESTTDRIYEIAEQVGYSDISHFSKKFKEYWGHSPQHFR